MFLRKTAYCTGSGRSRPRSFRTRMISLVGASGGRSRGTGSPDSRITTKTTVETSQSAMSALRRRWLRNGRRPRMGEAPAPAAPHLGERQDGTALGSAELEVEAPDLELLIRVGRELHVLLQPVVLVGLDDDHPREVLEEDPGHLAIGLTAELLVHGEARGVTEFVELGIAPVVHDAARAEQPPHHPVRIAEGGGRVRPPQPLEALLAILLGAHGVLDHLDLDVDADV